MATESFDATEGISFIPVGPLIRQRREALGLTRAELAERIGLATTADDIAILESDHIVMPSWLRLKQLADALEVSIADLLPAGPVPQRAVR
jgi:transcriptional regulator with XRE-family HTH domain